MNVPLQLKLVYKKRQVLLKVDSHLPPLICSEVYSTSAPPLDDSETEPESDGEDYEVVRQETDQDRRRLMDGMNRQELQGLKTISPPQRTSGENKLAPQVSD